MVNSSIKFGFDPLSDAKVLCSSFLQNNGITAKHKNDSILDYCVFNLRVPIQKPRSICKANSFVCPSDYTEKLLFLENRIKYGSSLAPFMTKNIRNLNKEDYLLNDWRIYHLHISDMVSDNFVERSSYLLLTLIDSESAYFIKYIKHPAAGEVLPWGLKEYLEIIDSNWPTITDNWVLNKNRDMQLVNQLTEEQYIKLRNHGCNCPVELNNGKIVLGIGGGVSADGSPTEAVFRSNYLKRELHSLPSLLDRFVAEGIFVVTGGLSMNLHLIDFCPFCWYRVKSDEGQVFEIYKPNPESFMIREYSAKN